MLRASEVRVHAFTPMRGIATPAACLLSLTSACVPCLTTVHCWYSALPPLSAPSRRLTRSETGEPLEGSTDRSWEGSVT